MADYTANVGGQGGTDPTVDKEQLIARVLDTVSAAKAFLLRYNFKLQDLIDAKDFEKMARLEDGANAVSGTLEERKQFQTYANELIKMVKYVDRDDISADTRREYEAIVAIFHQLQKKRKHASNVDLMVEINGIISEYVQVDIPSEGLTPSRRFDISQIDFDLLRREFARVKRKI